jgi:hypothetical protein
MAATASTAAWPSPHSVSLPSVSVHPKLSDTEAARFTTVEGVNRRALVATKREGGR